jgi:hypothetical protein
VDGYDNLQFSRRPAQSAGLTRWIGGQSTRMAMVVLGISAVIGIVASLAADQEPGTLLGFFIIVGSIAAVLSIQRGKSYLLFPVPALAFFVAAIAVGKVHDAKLGSSTASLGAGFTQWVAGIFFPAAAATILVVVIGGGRWLLSRQVVTGQSLLSPGGPAPRSPRPAPPRNPRPAPAPRRPARNDDPAVDDWADDSPFEDQVFKTEMIPAIRPDQPLPKPKGPTWTGDPSGGNPRSPRDRSQPPPRDQRPPRDRSQRQDHDPWGDPRLPPDRSQPPGTGPRPQQTGPRPQQSGPRPQQSGPRPQQTGPRPQQTGPRPQQSGGQPRSGAPRPSFNPNPPNQRPRRNPPENW